MGKIKLKKNMAVANDLGGGKKVRGTRIKNKLTDMEDRKTNRYDKSVDDWIKKNESK
jgi:hypothetical protein|tara:strand:- start:493 stop:663 length:171 start_codon:yes stop_codon:yes gene_type:complete